MKALQAIAHGATVVMLFLLWWQLFQTDQWNKDRLSAELLNSWNVDLKSNVKMLRSEYKENFHKGIPIPDATLIYGFDRPQVGGDRQKYEELYAEAVWMLNHLEYISQCYQHELVTREIIDESMKKFMISSYQALKPFIEEYSKGIDGNRTPWKPFTDLIGEWQDQRDHS